MRYLTHKWRYIRGIAFSVSCTREGFNGSQVAQPLSQLCLQSCTRLPLCSLRINFIFLLISIHSLHFLIFISNIFLQFLIVFLFNHTKLFQLDFDSLFLFWKNFFRFLNKKSDSYLLEITFLILNIFLTELPDFL